MGEGTRRAAAFRFLRCPMINVFRSRNLVPVEVTQPWGFLWREWTDVVLVA